MRKKYIWLDGAIVPWQDATIHISTHTLHYGSGAFEGLRCYATPHGPAIFRLQDHIQRLLQSAAIFGVHIPWTQAILKQAIIDTVAINAIDNCYIRPLIFFGSESLLLSPRNCTIHCAIIITEMHAELYTKEVTATISTIKRIDPESAPLHNKINGYYVNSIFALHDAQARGFDEAILLDHTNNIAEGSVANLFFVKDTSLITPPTDTILPGITRDSVITIAHAFNIPVHEERINEKQLADVTEAFFTGTAREITPIKKIDAHEFTTTPGIITQKIKLAYHAIVTGADPNFKNWLTFL